jgi:transposase
VSTSGKVDTCGQEIIGTVKRVKRQRRSPGEKLRIVEETLETGASVARVARRHGINANQVFYWRKQYREGRLGKGRPNNLLAVTVSENTPNRSGRTRGVLSPSSSGTMEINLPKGQVRVTGSVDREALQMVLENLLG